MANEADNVNMEENVNNNAEDRQNNNDGGQQNRDADGNAGNGNDNLFDNNLANPVPPILQNLPDALKLIRKYDGRTNINEWILRFETDLVAFSIPYKYACLSLDRFFIDDASNWWSSESHNFIFDSTKDENFFKNTWIQVVNALKAFFDHSALKEIHKTKNKSIVFKVGDDAQQYVTQKLATLKEIDQHMAEDRKLDQLLKGLPSNIRLQFSSQELNSVSQFLNRLRKYSQILMESHKDKFNPSHSVDRAFPNPSTTHATTTSHALHAIQQPPTATSFSQNCYLCNQPGHIRRDCPQNRGNRNSFPRNNNTPQRTRYPNNTQIPPLMNIPAYPPRPQFQPNYNNHYYQPRSQYYQPPQNSNNYNSRFSQNYSHPQYMPRAYQSNNPRPFPPQQSSRPRFTSQNPMLRQVRESDEPQSQNNYASEN